MYFPDGTEQSGYAWEFEYRREMDGSFLPFNIHKNGGICHGIPVRALYTVKILKLYPDVYRRITGRNCGRCENNNSSDGGADCLSVFRGGEQVECFGRRLSGKNIRMGFAVIMTAVTVLFAGTIAITVFDPQVPFIDILYEAFSAVGTVGLTADLTPTLSSASHMVLIVMMYIGRIGPISLALLFGGMSKPKERARELPEQRIMVG